MKRYHIKTTYYVTPEEINEQLCSLAKESLVQELENNKTYFEFLSDDKTLEIFKEKVQNFLNQRTAKTPLTVLVYDEIECIAMLRESINFDIKINVTLDSKELEKVLLR